MVVGEQIVQELVHLNDLGFHSVKDIESVHKLSEAMSGENVADLLRFPISITFLTTWSLLLLCCLQRFHKHNSLRSNIKLLSAPTRSSAIPARMSYRTSWLNVSSQCTKPMTLTASRLIMFTGTWDTLSSTTSSLMLRLPQGQHPLWSVFQRVKCLLLRSSMFPALNCVVMSILVIQPIVSRGQTSKCCVQR